MMINVSLARHGTAEYEGAHKRVRLARGIQDKIGHRLGHHLGGPPQYGLLFGVGAQAESGQA